MDPTAKKLDPVEVALGDAPELGSEDMSPEERAALEAAIRETRKCEDASGAEARVPHADVIRRAREHFGVE